MDKWRTQWRTHQRSSPIPFFWYSLGGPVATVFLCANKDFMCVVWVLNEYLEELFWLGFRLHHDGTRTTDYDVKGTQTLLRIEKERKGGSTVRLVRWLPVGTFLHSHLRQITQYTGQFLVRSLLGKQLTFGKSQLSPFFGGEHPRELVCFFPGFQIFPGILGLLIGYKRRSEKHKE